MNYAQQQRDPRRHFVGIGSVILIHVVVVYALVNGLARKVVEVFKKPLEVSIIEEVKVLPPPPPKSLPPPKAATPPPTFAPPPEIVVATPPPLAAVTATTQAPPPAPPAPAVVEAPRPTVVNVGVACPNHQEVRSRTPYPPQANRMGLSGEVLIEFTVTPSGEVADVAVLRSSNKIFNNAASSAVTQFRCVGQGRAVKVHVPFVFRLEN
ncbi:MAG: energy transducer TonB [Rhodocyclales bacterium]|nr:energy transducer TonB [Rhodocyclales bacterium]MBI5791459.1 energy transducer TonB [Rhodocyclales bacterium]